MLKKLFAVCAVALLLGACVERPPKDPGPVGPPMGDNKFTISFDTGSTVLSKASQETLDKAAARYKQGGVTQVTATGHTDTVGSSSSNDSLSQRRADVVKAGLVSRGIPVEAITVASDGERKLVVKTADEVAEPKNRVVVITFK